MYTQPKYFAFIDGEEKGPFSLSQLSDVGVRPSTYVWCKGMADWQRADGVEEIKEYFRSHLAGLKNDAPAVIDVTPSSQGASAGHPTQEKPSRPPRFSRFGISAEDAPEPEPDLNMPPRISMALAVCCFIFFPPTSIAAIIYTAKAQKCWNEALLPTTNSEKSTELRRNAHEYARQAKMWIGLSVFIGIIFWTLIFSL